MRIFGFILGLLLVAEGWCPAQVAIELLLDQDQFLRDESLPVKVRVMNRSGRTLHFEGEKDWLTFSIESRDGFLIAQRGELAVPGEFSLDSSQSASRTVDLMPYFDLSKPGRYIVSATLRVKAWNEELSSKPRNFDIVRGTKIWEQEFGVPSSGGPPEVRKYALQKATYLKQLKLYVRLTDLNEHKVFRVVPIGPMVSFGQPEALVDKASNLHVLVQTGARSFIYTTTSPDGEILARQTHDYAQTRPVLRTGENGRILISGGVRRVTSDDHPPTPADSPIKDGKP